MSKQQLNKALKSRFFNNSYVRYIYFQAGSALIELSEQPDTAMRDFIKRYFPKCSIIW